MPAASASKPYKETPYVVVEVMAETGRLRLRTAETSGGRADYLCTVASTCETPTVGATVTADMDLGTGMAQWSPVLTYTEGHLSRSCTVTSCEADFSALFEDDP